MKILLIDHHALFRDGMRYFLQHSLNGVDEILEAESFFDGLELARAHHDLGLILLELQCPDSEGAISVKRLRQCCPHVPVVVVSIEEDRSVMDEALGYGASTCICKNVTGSAFLNALSSVYSGGTHLPEKLQQPKATGKTVSDDRRSNANEYGLTVRQMEVLRCLATGLSNKEIASVTGLAGGTIKMHLTDVYQTLCVKNRNEAIRVARRIGLVDRIQA